MSHLEITEVLLIHCNIVNNDYQQDSRVLNTLDILAKNFIVLKTFNSEFSYIEVQFTDQNSKPLDITLAINYSVKYKKQCAIQFKLEIEYL